MKHVGFVYAFVKKA